MHSADMDAGVTVTTQLRLPVRTITVDGLPKIMAGGMPVTPVNVALAQRKRKMGATEDSLDAYVRAGRLYAEFCAHLGRSIIDITDQDFARFTDALLGLSFPDAGGHWVRMTGKRPRGKRTVDLMLSLIYSIAGDIEDLYGVRFAWRRYGRLPEELIEVVRALGGGSAKVSLPRSHSVSWTPRKVLGLPDEQFVKLINAARKRWGDEIPDGDAAFAGRPEGQRGALFYRNVAILCLLRYAGGRRAEVTFIQFCDIRREESKLYLVTKGHGGEAGERLPVVLFPFVDELIWFYATRFRPDVDDLTGEQSRRVFLSHSARNYGRVITPQSVNRMVQNLRGTLDAPWNETLTPHMLRHSFGYDLQRLVGPAGTTSNMRHASGRSGEPYRAGVENFVDVITESMNGEVGHMLSRAGLLELVGGKIP